MANIDDLGAATTPLDGTELVEVLQAGVNKQVVSSELGGGAGGLWEHIGTDISSSSGDDLVVSGFSGYVRFEIVVADVANGDLSTQFTINGDGGSNYEHQRHRATGTSTSIIRNTGGASFPLQWTTTPTRGRTFLRIEKYSATEPASVWANIIRSSGSSVETLTLGGWWNNTSDMISSFKVDGDGGALAAGSRLTVFGSTV